MPVWKNLIILILYPDPILQLVFCVLMNKIEFLKQIAKFHDMAAAFKFLALAFSQVFMVLYSYNIYVLLPTQLAKLLCLSINIYQILYTELSCLIFKDINLKGLQIICKPRHMKCFQTIVSNSYLLTQLLFSHCFSSQVRFDVYMQKKHTILC